MLLTVPLVEVSEILLEDLVYESLMENMKYHTLEKYIRRERRTSNRCSRSNVCCILWISATFHCLLETMMRKIWQTQNPKWYRNHSRDIEGNGQWLLTCKDRWLCSREQASERIQKGPHLKFTVVDMKPCVWISTCARMNVVVCLMKKRFLSRNGTIHATSKHLRPLLS